MNGELRLGAVVEGHGEVRAVPVLLRRMLAEIRPGSAVRIPTPVRYPRSRLLRTGELERAVVLAAEQAGEGAAVLVLIDADDDCPAELAPSLLRRVRGRLADRPSTVVLAKREFEAWFLAAARSLRGYRGLPQDLEPPTDPEGVRGAKEWLAHRMGRYRPTLDQPALAAIMDLEEARRAPSFDKLWRDLERIFGEAP